MRRYHWLLWLSLALAVASGCRQQGAAPTAAAEDPSEPPELSAQETAEPASDGDAGRAALPPSPFKPGTWLAQYPDGSGEYYFFDAGALSGCTASLENGMGLGFVYTLNEDGAAVFHMGAADEEPPCAVSVSDEDHITLLWEGKDPVSLTFVSPLDDREFFFYTNEELCRMALDRYEGERGLAESGLTPSACNGAEGTVTVQVGDARYRVDRRTGQGTELDTGEPVDLTEYLAPDAVKQ